MRDCFIGIDTSNYTSSCAAVSGHGESISKRRLLPVEKGKLGLRQSDAVFHHVRALPELLCSLLDDIHGAACVSYSFAPTDLPGSYMPCFTVGKGFAEVLAKSLGVRLNAFSHQSGHIAAALYSSGREELFGREFIAFHFSGGTTQALKVTPDSEKIFSVAQLAASLDLKAGQAVDRVGAMLGMDFPAGKELDALALKSEKSFRPRPYVRDGSVSFSGVENTAAAMLKDSAEPCDIAKYCICYISRAAEIMSEYALSVCGELPIVYAGGVMSNSYIRQELSKRYDCAFASAELSSDNAVGTALLGRIKELGV